MGEAALHGGRGQAPGVQAGYLSKRAVKGGGIFSRKWTRRFFELAWRDEDIQRTGVHGGAPFIELVYKKAPGAKAPVGAYALLKGMRVKTPDGKGEAGFRAGEGPKDRNSKLLFSIIPGEGLAESARHPLHNQPLALT